MTDKCSKHKQPFTHPIIHLLCAVEASGLPRPSTSLSLSRRGGVSGLLRIIEKRDKEKNILKARNKRNGRGE